MTPDTLTNLGMILLFAATVLGLVAALWTMSKSDRGPDTQGDADTDSTAVVNNDPSPKQRPGHRRGTRLSRRGPRQ